MKQSKYLLVNLCFTYVRQISFTANLVSEDVKMIGKFINKLRRSEAGATAIEYGLIAALIAVALIGALQAVQSSLSTTFTKVSTELDAASGGSSSSGG